MKESVYQLIFMNGYYQIEFFKSKEEWMSFFQSKEYASTTLKTKTFLQRYYIEVNESGCFSDIYQQYQEPISNSYIKSLGDRALRFFHEEISIFEKDSKIEKLSKRWPIFFLGRYTNRKSHFEWKLRKEIVEAIDALDMFQTWHNLKKDKEKQAIEKLNSQVESIEKLSKKRIISDTEMVSMVKTRIGQGYFRDQLLKRSSRCEICGLSHPNLLVASHIKSWKDANHNERLDMNNGLLLCAMHDALFDKHLISFSDDGKILISSLLSDADLEVLKLNTDMTLQMNAKMRFYMKNHRKVFKQYQRKGK